MQAAEYELFVINVSQNYSYSLDVAPKLQEFFEEYLKIPFTMVIWSKIYTKFQLNKLILKSILFYFFKCMILCGM